jgi:hypothetical protein
VSRSWRAVKTKWCSVTVANRTAGRSNISIDYKFITKCTASYASQKIRHTRLLEAFMTIRDEKDDNTMYTCVQKKTELFK